MKDLLDWFLRLPLLAQLALIIAGFALLVIALLSGPGSLAYLLVGMLMGRFNPPPPSGSK